MTTAGDLINETKRYLLAQHREQLNQLTNPIVAADTSLTFTHTLGSLAAGAYISVDLEIMYVWDVTAASQTANVSRGMLGSVAASHAMNALVTVNPKFPDFSVLQAINADLNDLSGQGLYQATTASLTYVSGQFGYNLTGATDVQMGLDVRYDYPGLPNDWPAMKLWDIRRNADTSEFASGFQVTLREVGYPGAEVRVTYARPFSPLTATADDVLAVAGLQVPAHDLPPLGAALRLQGVREGQRNFNEAQPDTRRSAEIPAGAQITSLRGLADFRQSRIKSEKARLLRQYPYHRKVV